MQHLQHADVFALPVSHFMTHKHSYRVHTWPSFVCSFFFYIMSLIAFGFLCASIAGADDYVSQSINWSNTLPGSTPFVSDPSDFVFAYKTSLNESYVIGQFYQRYDDLSYGGVSSQLCTDLYTDKQILN